MNKTATHNNLTCIFNEADHSYRIKETGDLLTSVTTIIKRFTPPFDTLKMAQLMIDKRKPAYVGMTLEEIIESWKNKASHAALEGTLLHSYAELWPETKGYGFHPKTPRVLSMCEQVDRLFPKLLKRFRIIEAEKIVFSASLGLAGQIDLVMADDAAQQGIIIDWKTNGKVLTDSESAFGKMLSPIDHLANCDVVRYGLQLALYEKILTDEGYYPEFKGYRKALVHVREAYGKIVKVDNYKDEIECLLI
jgi:hypothetical protein